MFFFPANKKAKGIILIVKILRQLTFTQIIYHCFYSVIRLNRENTLYKYICNEKKKSGFRKLFFRMGIISAHVYTC